MSLSSSEAKKLFIATFDFKKSHLVVFSYLANRHLMTQPSFERMAEELIPGEITELEVEANKRGTPEYDAKAERTEGFDNSFFASSVAYSFSVVLDRTKAMSYMNGQGKQSNIFDRMKEKSGNFSRKTIFNDLHSFYGDLYSYFASMPVPFNADETMQIVLEKNSRNYPQLVFEAKDHQTGKPLSPDEQIEAYNHRKTSINFVRRTLRDRLGYKDRAYGLKPEDYISYLPYIMDFRNSYAAFLALTRQFSKDHQIAI